MSKLIDISEVLLEMGLTDSVTDVQRAIISQQMRRSTGQVIRYLGYDPVQATRTEYYPQSDYGGMGQQLIYDVNASSAFQRRLSGGATDQLQLKHLPIRSITTLAIDYGGRSDTVSGSFTDVKSEGNDFWANYDLVDASGNKVCTDGILYSEGLWSSAPGSIKITYIAGYTEDELRGSDPVIDASPIWDTVLSETVRRAKYMLSTSYSANRGGFVVGTIETEKLGEYSYSVATNTTNRTSSGIYDLLPESKERIDSFVNMGYMLGG